MDDIYFSDKKRRDSYASDKNEFLETDYYDEDFSLNFKKGAGNAQSFISESGNNNYIRKNSREAYSGNPIKEERRHSPDGASIHDRTPQGRPVSQQKPHQHTSSQTRTNPPSRTPTGQRVSSQQAARPHQAQQRPPQRSHQSTPQRPSPVKHSTPKKKRKNSSESKKKLLLAVAAAFVLLILAVFGYGFIILGNMDYDDDIIENRYLDSYSFSDPNVKNILFIGSDARGDVEGQRSDTMILFSIDSNNRQIKLSSFLRDSYLYIPYLEYDTKLNASYSLGGAQATIDALEYNFGVDIDNYITVNFDVFEKVVDGLGGITVEVTEDEAEYMREDVQIPWVKEGKNQFNGFVALWYCRIRQLDSDFYRTQRQRKVISAIIDKATKTNPLTLMKMVNDVVSDISTDIPRGEIISLGANALFRYLRYDIVQQQIPADGTCYDDYVDGSYVLGFDVDENAEILQDFLKNKVSK